MANSSRLWLYIGGRRDKAQPAVYLTQASLLTYATGWALLGILFHAVCCTAAPAGSASMLHEVMRQFMYNDLFASLFYLLNGHVIINDCVSHVTADKPFFLFLVMNVIHTARHENQLEAAKQQHRGLIQLMEQQHQSHSTPFC
jgi:hypothetical protein